MAIKLNGKTVGGKADIRKAKNIRQQQKSPLQERWDELKEKRQTETSAADAIWQSVQKRWDERKTQRAYDRIVGEAAKNMPGDMNLFKYNYAPPNLQASGKFEGGIKNVSQQSSGKI